MKKCLFYFALAINLLIVLACGILIVKPPGGQSASMKELKTSILFFIYLAQKNHSPKLYQ
ncbi:hypothetical protein ACEQPO_16650 [Bacillus sp. SL00103]